MSNIINNFCVNDFSAVPLARLYAILLLFGTHISRVFLANYARRAHAQFHCQRRTKTQIFRNFRTYERSERTTAYISFWHTQFSLRIYFAAALRHLKYRTHKHAERSTITFPLSPPISNARQNRKAKWQKHAQRCRIADRAPLSCFDGAVMWQWSCGNVGPQLSQRAFHNTAWSLEQQVLKWRGKSISRQYFKIHNCNLI